MSKSLNLFLPAAGGAALVLGGAYGIATNIYASDKVTVLENQVEIARTEATAEVTRAAEIEAKALELQEEARRQIASAGSLTLTQPAPAASSGYGLGRTALAEEIAAWDVDVLPDGLADALPNTLPNDRLGQ